MKKTILISIQPKYVNKIKKNKKLYEFRKIKFDPLLIDKIYIYQTKPSKKIIGYFSFKEVTIGTPQEIWDKCSNNSGMGKLSFFKYYKKCKISYSYKIDDFVLFDKELCPYTELENFQVPQSFIYFDKHLDKLNEINKVY